MVVTPPNIVNVEHELFWKEVIEAVHMIEVNHGITLTIERGTRRADIFWTEWEDTDGIGIEITEVTPKQPALIVPTTS